YLPKFFTSFLPASPMSVTLVRPGASALTATAVGSLVGVTDTTLSFSLNTERIGCFVVIRRIVVVPTGRTSCLGRAVLSLFGAGSSAQAGRSRNRARVVSARTR